MLKDIGYIRAVMMRLNPERVPYVVIRDVEEGIKKAEGRPEDQGKEAVKVLLPFFKELVAEYKLKRDIKELTQSLYRIKPDTSGDQGGHPPRYNSGVLTRLRAKVRENMEWIQDAIDKMKSAKMDGNDDLQKLEVEFNDLRESEFTLKQEHDSAQPELKKAPRERSLSKVPINERPSVIMESAGGEVEAPGPIIEM